MSELTEADVRADERERIALALEARIVQIKGTLAERTGTQILLHAVFMIRSSSGDVT